MILKGRVGQEVSHVGGTGTPRPGGIAKGCGCAWAAVIYSGEVFVFLAGSIFRTKYKPAVEIRHVIEINALFPIFL